MASKHIPPVQPPPPPPQPVFRSAIADLQSINQMVSTISQNLDSPERRNLNNRMASAIHLLLNQFEQSNDGPNEGHQNDQLSFVGVNNGSSFDIDSE